MNVSIRPLVADDQPVARRVILSGLGEHFASLDPDLNPDLKDLFGHYIAKGHLFAVAEVAGEIIGTGGLLLADAEKVGRIVRVSVRRDLRGRGIGRAIVEYLLDLARQAQVNRVVVETNHDWFAALALYQSCAFTEYDQDEESIHLECWL